MSTLSLDCPTTNTQHGLLVAFGEFLSQHGLLDALRQVPIPQKAREFSPQAKLIELLAGIMSGIEYLSDLSAGPRPLVEDQVVARAWGLPGFAHASGVSRTLTVCDEATEAAVDAAITAFSHPFIETRVSELLRRGRPIVYDLDLTGQAVSATSTTYPGAAFGWMNDHVRLGYQLARVCLSSDDGERVWLAGFHHPGDTVSSRCLKELILAAEAQTQIRPRRRVELVLQRIATQQASVERLQRLIQQQDDQLAHLHATRTELIGQVYQAQQAVAHPNSSGKQADWQVQLQRAQQRLPRVEVQITRGQAARRTHQTREQTQQLVLTALRTWQAYLESDNHANPNPPPLVWARTDAGFTSGDNLTWLLEMGYAPDTKAPNGQTTTALRAKLPPDASWERVGDNAEMSAIGAFTLHGCPFPLTAALERFKVNDTFRYATLIRYAGDLPVSTLAAWFQHYNARQTIEAANKEMKSTFCVQHLMSHSSVGIRLQVHFTGLATNAIRWCRPWLKRCVAQSTPQLTRTLNSPKQMVRVAANSAALVCQTPTETTLQFAPDSALPGAALCLRGVAAFQLPLALHQPGNFASL